jgi:hypothetical protein
VPDFSAQISDFCKATEQRLEVVFKESAQRTVSIAQSLVPVDTGFLRASIRGSNEAMPEIDPKARPTDVSYTYNAGEIVLTIAGAKLGGTFFCGYSASYASALEFGTSKIRPRRFVGQATEQWQATVNQVCRDLEATVAARAAPPQQPVP